MGIEAMTPGRYIFFYLLKHIHLVAIFVMSSAVKGENLNTKAQLCGEVQQAGVHGISNFMLIIQCQNETYVDKTLFIRDAILSNMAILLFTLPRRFGKSLLLSTVDYYVNFRSNDSEHLFSGLNIATPELATFKKKHMHKYAVILLNFGGIHHTTFAGAWGSIKRSIAEAFEKHDYLLDKNTLDEDTKKIFLDYIRVKFENESLWASAIQFLCTCLSSHFQDEISTFIMIDEYDTPMHAGYANKYYGQMTDFFQEFYCRSFKINTKYKKAVLTGVIRTGKETWFSSLNSIVSYATLENKFASYCGFTAEEVNLLIERAKKGKEVGKMLETRYKGYQFGNTVIFNPWSVILDLFANRPFGWADSGSTQKLEILLKSHGLYPVLTLQRLLARESVTKIVRDNLVYKDINMDERAYWTFLVQLGYLTCGTHSAAELDSLLVNSWNVTLRIPNHELMLNIKQALYVNHDARLRMKIPSYSNLVDNLVAGNYTLAKLAIESYIKDAGVYFRRSGENYNSKKLTDYVTQILNGVALRYRSGVSVKETPGKVGIEILPKNKEGYPIFVVLKEKPMSTSMWRSIKNSLCSFLKPGHKNKTEIVIQYTKDVLEVCLAN